MADLPSGQPDEGPGSIDQPVPNASSGFDTLSELVSMNQRARTQLLRCAELLTTAAYLVDTGLSSERLDAIKWQFVRGYVTVTGYLFNESYFVRRYVEHLVQQTRVTDPGQFRASLSQGLLQNSLPLTRDVFIDWLADEGGSINAEDFDTTGNSKWIRPENPDPECRLH